MCLCSSMALSAGAEPREHHVLVLYSYHAHLPWSRDFDLGLRAAAEDSPLPLVLHHEYLEQDRLPAQTDAFWLRYLQQKYREVLLAAVIAESDDAARLIHANRDDFPARHAIYASDARLSIGDQDRQLRLSESLHVETTLQRMVQQLPDLRRVIVIDSRDTSSELNYARLRAVAPNYPSIVLEHWTDFEFSGLYRRASQLPPDSAIYYNLVFKDRNGDLDVPKNVLRQLADASPVPVYAPYASLMGSGAVGGHMLDAGSVARSAINGAVELISGGSIVLESTLSRDLYDHAALIRYDIPLSRLPEHHVLMNQQEPWWYQYFALLVWISSLIGILCMAAIAWALMLRRQQEALSAAHRKLGAANRELTTLTRIDSLTGLLNRRAMVELLETMPPARAGKAHYLVLLDLDHFKNINDQHGHAEGDRVLIRVASALRETLRDSDPVARWGGEEFLIAIAHVSAERVARLAEKLRSNISELHFANIGKVTASFGVARLTPHESIDRALEHADRALYKAKRSGRDQVQLWKDEVVVLRTARDR